MERLRQRVPLVSLVVQGKSNLLTLIDIYCYSCDDAKIDPELSIHLSNFGIEVLSQEKTEKSSTELVSKTNCLAVTVAD